MGRRSAGLESPIRLLRDEMAMEDTDKAVTTDTVKAVASDFLTRTAPGVLVLKGAWGVGKTHAWKRLVEAEPASLEPKKYSYVSLFGLRTISDLRMAIVAKARLTSTIGQRLTPSTINEEFWPLAKSYGSGLVRTFKNLPYVNNISLALESLASSLIQPSIICLDDFERAAIDADEVLGLVSELKEEKGCKVVLIFNEDRLGANRERYNLYREKVVDIELSYDPKVTESAAIAFPDTFVHRDLATKCAEKLNLKNIRILKRAAQIIELVSPPVRELHEKITEQLVMTSVLVSWSLYSDGDKVPIDFLRHWNSFTWSIRDVARHNQAQAQPDPQQEAADRWGPVLNSYPYITTDDLDRAVILVAERGYLQESNLEESAHEKHEELKQFDLRERFTKAWRTFHDSFGDDRAKLIAEMADSFKAAAHQIEPVNLDATVRLLRELGESALADELVEVYVAAQRKKEVFDLEKSAFGQDVKDERVLQAFKDQILKLTPMSLRDAMYFLAQGGGYNAEHIEAVERATDDDLYGFFKEDHKEALKDLVRGVLRFAGDDRHKDIGDKARRVLQRIAGENDLNRMRMRRFGIEPAARAAEPAPAAAPVSGAPAEQE